MQELADGRGAWGGVREWVGNSVLTRSPRPSTCLHAFAHLGALGTPPIWVFLEASLCRHDSFSHWSLIDHPRFSVPHPPLAGDAQSSNPLITWAAPQQPAPILRSQRNCFHLTKDTFVALMTWESPGVLGTGQRTKGLSYKPQYYSIEFLFLKKVNDWTCKLHRCYSTFSTHQRGFLNITDQTHKPVEEASASTTKSMVILRVPSPEMWFHTCSWEDTCVYVSVSEAWLFI